MRVDLALFDGDTLLERQEILVTSTPKVERFGFFRASYELGPDAAEVVLDDFSSPVELRRSTLTIPVHESSDWESIELDRYTLAFWCLWSAKTQSSGLRGALPRLWHHWRVRSAVAIILGVLSDLAGWIGLQFRRRSSLEAEVLFLRRQLAFYVERRVKPRRVNAAARVSLVMLSRLFDWRSALVVVRPEALIRWHRMGWKLFWRLKSRPGRPPIPAAIQALIRRMARENPLWGEERIANELLLKLGLHLSPRTVSKYLPRRPRGRPRGDLRWSTFLRLHGRGLIACDFFVAVTARFRLLYVLVVIEHGSRRLVHFNVTRHPTAAWTLQQLREVVG